MKIYYDTFILSFKKTYKNYYMKKFVISEGGYK